MDMPPPPIEVFIERVVDGDTFELGEELFGAKILRIENFDLPETRRAQCEKEKKLGYESTGYAKALYLGKPALLYTSGKRDRYGRLLGNIVYENGSYGSHMVKIGYAVRTNRQWWATPKNKRWC